MVNIEELFERINTLDGIDVQGIIDFIELMAQGKTSEWYTPERKAKFARLDFTQAHSIIDGARSARLRKSLIDNKLRQIPQSAVSINDYF